MIKALAEDGRNFTSYQSMFDIYHQLEKFEKFFPEKLLEMVSMSNWKTTK